MAKEVVAIWVGEFPDSLPDRADVVDEILETYGYDLGEVVVTHSDSDILPKDGQNKLVIHHTSKLLDNDVKRSLRNSVRTRFGTEIIFRIYQEMK